MSDYTTYKEKLVRIKDIQSSAAVLNWDQETYMPPKGARFRGQQLATLLGLAHEMFTNNQMGDLLEKLSEDNSLSWEEHRNVAETRRDYLKERKLSTDFVERLTLATSDALQKWHQAKVTNDFDLFAPSLEKIIDLKLEQADLIGYEEHPYNALLDDYEPGMTVSVLDPLFEYLRPRLLDLLSRVNNSREPDILFASQRFDKDQQWKLGLELLKRMNYDFEAGRQDLSSHPFSISFSPEDARVTTRVNEADLFDMISSCIHEGGHALYEQGLLPANYGLPAGAYVSLGIHESQSRLWENNVGRSLAYWESNFPLVQSFFPNELKGVTAFRAFQATNMVKPSLIRVQADELTYHFHILVRYEIEKAILMKQVKVAELPELWNARYKEYLDIDVPDNGNGVLQDIHWSHGSFGYFPTYSLGSMYAAQIFKKIESDIPALTDKIRDGDLLPIKSWLNNNIHQYGRLYSAEDLCEKTTGEKLDVTYFLTYLENKLGQVYGW